MRAIVSSRALDPILPLLSRMERAARIEQKRQDLLDETGFAVVVTAIQVQGAIQEVMPAWWLFPAECTHRPRRRSQTALERMSMELSLRFIPPGDADNRARNYHVLTPRPRTPCAPKTALHFAHSCPLRAR